jgi:ATP-dependent DNA helicase PIF1
LSFVNAFRNQGKPASKVIEREIKRWKLSGLSGSEAGKSYNNGWRNPKNPEILNRRITSYANYGQVDYDIDPTRVSKQHLDEFYKILRDINCITDPQLDLDGRINKLDSWNLPITRRKKDLFVVWEERKYEIILQKISTAETVSEVENETSNINSLPEKGLLNKKKTYLFKAQNERLNSFLNEKQKKIFQLVVTNKENLFFTGAAGTGKSFLLQRIINSLKLSSGEESVAVTATTGIAAVNIGGITLNSFAGIGLGDSSPEDMVKMVKRSGNARKRWQATETLIIDEVSMLSGELFDKLELIARIIRNSSRVFGGLNLVLSGDFFQLSPVSGKYLFEAREWENCIKYNIKLVKVHRQKEAEFIELLNELRLGEISDKNSKFLRQLAREPDYPNDEIKPTWLYATNEEAKKVNKTELEQLSSLPYFYQAMDWESSSGKLKAFENSLIPSNLCLKYGTQVMLIKNLSEKLVNGSQGVVIGFREKECKLNQYVERDKKSEISKRSFTFNLPIVRFTNGVEEIVEPTEWTVETPINRIVRASRQQIPLILSWAITIHKSQGQTIERIKVDCRRIFATGQLYVALSRATSIKYLQIIGFRKDKVLCDEKVKNFYRNLSI